jgi:hypothetical protein
MCENSEQTLFSTQINILGYSCDNVAIYMSMLLFYLFLIAGKHKLSTNTGQIHREALLKKANKRNLCRVAGYNIAHTIIHIIYVLFITSNNVGFLLASIFAHCIGVILVYKTQRPDHEHPIRSLARAIRNIENADRKTKEEFTFILQKIKLNKMTF